jgi:trk system potassium uptake protein TrkA
VQVVHGDACDPGVLLEAGADHADVLVAATGDDEDNLVLTLLAKNEFKKGDRGGPKPQKPVAV